jgi:hypothetical protein
MLVMPFDRITISESDGARPHEENWMDDVNRVILLKEAEEKKTIIMQTVSSAAEFKRT